MNFHENKIISLSNMNTLALVLVILLTIVGSIISMLIGQNLRLKRKLMNICDDCEFHNQCNAMNDETGNQDKHQCIEYNVLSNIHNGLQNYREDFSTVNLETIEDPVSLEAVLKISYPDENEEEKERIVVASYFVFGGEFSYLYAYCLLSKSEKLFHVDKITSCIDMLERTSIDNVSQYLINKYLNSIEHTIDILRKKDYDVLRILKYIIKLDHKLIAVKEKQVETLFREHSKDRRININNIYDLLEHIPVPKESEFKQIIYKIREVNQETRHFIFALINAIMEGNSDIDLSVRQALNFIVKHTI